MQPPAKPIESTLSPAVDDGALKATSGPPAAAAPSSQRRDRAIYGSLVTLAFAAGVWLISWGRGFLIPVSFSIFLMVCLKPPVMWLRRLRVPMPIGAALVLIAISAGLALAVERTRDDAAKVLDEMPAATRYLQREINAAMNNPGSIAHRIKVLTQLPAATGGNTKPSSSNATMPPVSNLIPAAFAEGTKQFFSVASELGAVLFLVYLMLASCGRLERRLTQHEDVSPRRRQSIHSATLQIEQALRNYLGVMVLTNALLGGCTWTVFSALGVNYAAAWGLAAAAAHFMPYVGPTIIAVAATVFASVQFDSLPHGLGIGAVTLGLSALLGVGLQTWMSGRSVRMNTVAVFVSLMFWGWIWGLPGLVLGTPLTMALKVVCAHIPGLNWIDALLDVSRRRSPPHVHAVPLRAVERTPATCGCSP